MAFLNKDEMKIFLDNIDDSEGTITHNLSNIIDFVIKYNFQGGPEQPIRYLEMQVNKNDIDLKYPHLMDSIVEGKTRLLIKAVDGGTFVITKIWLNDNRYELVATGIEVTLNTATLSQDDVDAINETNLDPPAVVQTIFTRWANNLNLTTAGDGYADGFQLYQSSSLQSNRHGAGYSGQSVNSFNDLQSLSSSDAGTIVKVTGENKFYVFTGEYDDSVPPKMIWVEWKIQFKENMPTLVAINMCALMDDAFIFFANKNGVNTFYYVSYDDIYPLAYNPADSSKNGVVNIYPRMSSQYENYTKFDLMMFKQLIGMSSKNSEGSETIVNKQVVSVENSSATFVNDDSTAMYGDYTGAQVMSDMIVTPDAMIIAMNIVRRYKDPTRSITIQLSEVKSDNTGSGWEEAIPTFSYAYKIIDNVNNITLENKHLCDGETNNFMLRLSTFIRSYPEMTSEYTFGVMKETTLSQELANKLTGMSGTVADVRYNSTSIVVNGVVTVDTAPTNGSRNPVSSDGVYDALRDGSVTKVGTSNVGSGTNPIYLNAGTPTASSSNAGSDSKPLKLSDGVLTPVTNDLATKSSVDNIINGTTTVGSSTTASRLNQSGNVGGTLNPVYFSNGSPVVTSCPIVRAGYASGGSSGLEIDLGRSDVYDAPSSVVVTPRYSGSPDYPADGWAIGSPFKDGTNSWRVKVWHGSGIIAGWNWVAVWM